MTPLAPLRVLDLTTRIPGAYCTKLLAGFGADVLKIEPPGGDPMRGSLAFLWYHTGKKSIVLDDRQKLLSLAASADVVIEDQGFDCESVRASNPGLVVTSISPFGRSGPYKDFQAEEITLYAMSGLMNSTGDGAREPLAGGPPIAQLSAGLQAYIGTLMALYRARQTGVGDLVEVSVHEAAMDNLENAIVEYLHTGNVGRRNRDEHKLVPWRTYPCKDGMVAIIGGPVRHWLKAVDMFGEPELLTSKYAHVLGRMKNRKEFQALMQPWLSVHTRKEIFHEGQKRRLAWGYIATPGEVLQMEHLAARDYFSKMQHPDGFTYRMPGAPFRMSKTPWQQQRAPMLNEHATTNVATPAAPKNSKPGAQVLAGMRVLDLTHDWAGPHAGRMLGDHGADVLKVEYTGRLDSMRGAELDRIDAHPRWWQMNRNKGSITLDFHVPEHVEVFRRLAAKTDIVLENSRPGVMAKWGIGYDDLRKIKPDLIMVSMSGFGATGPESQYAGYGGSLECLSGVQSLTAYDPKGEPLRVREVDVTNGLMGACAAMTALAYRQRTGEGQWVDLSELETSAWLIGEHLLESEINKAQTLPLGNRHPTFAPQGCYPCRGEDRWVVLTIRSDKEWDLFCTAAGHPEWAQESRFKTAALRKMNHDVLNELIGVWSKQNDAEAIMYSLQSAGIAAGRVANARDLAEDPHLAARGWFQTSPDTDKEKRYPGFPFRLERAGGAIRRHGPALGADNKRIFCDELGLPESLIPKVGKDTIRTAFETS